MSRIFLRFGLFLLPLVLALHTTERSLAPSSVLSYHQVLTHTDKASQAILYRGYKKLQLSRCKVLHLNWGNPKQKYRFVLIDDQRCTELPLLHQLLQPLAEQKAVC